MVIAGREITQEEAQYYYTRNKYMIKKRLERFPESNEMTQAFIRWNERIKEEFDVVEEEEM